MNTDSNKNLIIWLNSLEVVGIVILLTTAFGLQFSLNELPCPLCLLQRVGFLGIASGLLLNLRFGPKPCHYAISMLFAFFTAMVALRQVCLHIVPGSGSYGSSIFGLHLYTWSFVVSVVVLVFTTLILSCSKQYKDSEHYLQGKAWLSKLLFSLVALLIAANMVSTFLECGFGVCADDPVSYVMLKTFA